MPADVLVLPLHFAENGTPPQEAVKVEPTGMMPHDGDAVLTLALLNP
jgi:hypothetical protein